MENWIPNIIVMVSYKYDVKVCVCRPGASETGINIGPDITGLTNKETFSVQWRGYVVPDKTEEITLWTRSDDGVRVYLDGELVIDNWTDHPVTTDRVKLRVEAGRPYALAVQYYQRFGGSVGNDPVDAVPL